MTSKYKLQHLAIIMDGNRRWAKKKGRPKMFGHKSGSDTLRDITTAVRNRGIPYLTVWALSTDNLRRDKKELAFLFRLFEKMITYLEDFTKNNAQVKLIGNLDLLPKRTKKVLENLVEKTKDNKDLVLTLAVAYGGKDELVRGYKKLAEQKVTPDDITEEKLESALDSKNLPDIDLLIRTGGHQRLSSFMLWKVTYAELYFTDILWPAFTEKDLDDAIAWYNKQERNFGK